MKAGVNVPVSYFLPEWLRTPRVPILVANEVRATLPLLFPGLVLVLLSSVVSSGAALSLGIFGYGFGSAAVAAMLFGHDFSHHTLGLALAQPIHRERLWRVRMRLSLALACLLAVPAGAGFGLYHYLLFAARNGVSGDSIYALLLFAAPAVAAVSLSPFFTLLCRSALAGAVFTICTPFGLILLAQWCFTGFGVALGIQQEQFVFWFVAVIAAIMSISAFCAARRRFMRLEVLDVSSRAASAQGHFHTFRLGRRSPGWAQLGWKELRLQPMSLVLAAGLVLTCVSLGRPDAGGNGNPNLVLATMLWAVAICVILGAVGSAEERQLGMTQIQAVQPKRRTIQWLIKVAVVLGLAQVLAVILPVVLLNFVALPREAAVPELRWWCIAALSITSLSLYQSSGSPATLQAIFRTLPLVPFVMIALSFAHEVEARILSPSGPEAFSWARSELQIPYIALAAGSALLLAFAKSNHFAAEIGGRPLLRQVLRLAGIMGAVVLIGMAWAVKTSS